MKLITTGISELDIQRFTPITNDKYDFRNKPLGGLWASTYYEDEEYGYSSEWISFCRYDFFRDAEQNLIDKYLQKYKNGVIFEIKDDSKICEIDNISDYLRILKTYSRIVEEKMALDFEKLSKDYDVIHLTENAVNEMRFILDYRNIIDFYSWDCESFIIFNLDCIDMDNSQVVEINYEK